MITAQECYKTFPNFGYLSKFISERGFGFIAFSNGNKIFAHIRAGIPQGLKVTESDLGQPCLFIVGRISGNRKDAAVSWCLSRDVEWGDEGPCAEEMEYVRWRQHFLSALNRSEISRLLTDRPVEQRDLDDPMLETLVRDCLRSIPTSSQEFGNIAEALLDSPFRFAPSLIKAVSLLKRGDDLFDKGKLKLLLSVFSPWQLASVIAPHPLLLPLVEKGRLPYLLEWALRAERRPSDWTKRLDADFGCEQRVATKLLADDEYRFDYLATSWVERQLDRGIVKPDAILERLRRHPDEEQRWVNVLDDAQRALWFSQNQKTADLIELAASSDDPQVLDIAIKASAMAVDLETDGDLISQIAISDGDSSESIYDGKSGGKIKLQEAMNILEDRVKARQLLVGHNVIAWDIPVLQKYEFVLGDFPLVWDTLLVSYLLAPWEASHSLGGTHNAESDAKDAYSLFTQQVNQIGARKVINLVHKLPTDDAGLIGALLDLPNNIPFDPPEPPGWFKALKEHHLSPGQNRKVIVPRRLLSQVMWIKDVTISVMAPGVDQDLDIRVIDVKRFSATVAERAPSDPHAAVLAKVLARAEEHSVRVRVGMVPLWLREAPAVKECLSNSTVADHAIGIVFSAYPKTGSWYVSDEAQYALFVFPPRTGWVTDDSWNSRVALPQSIAHEIDRDPPTVPTLYRANGSDEDNRGAQWIFFDLIRQRLNHGGGCYRTFKITPADLLKEQVVAEGFSKAQLMLIDWGDRTYLHATTEDQRSYWLDVLERVKSIAVARRETVLLVLIVSSDEPKLLGLVEDALVALGLAQERRLHWSRLERLRRAEACEGKKCIVDFADHLPEWSRLAHSSGVRITPVIEAVPLPEWKALTHAVLDEDGDTNYPDGAMAQDEEDLEEPAGIDVGCDDSGESIAYRHKQVRAGLVRVPLTVSPPEMKTVLDSCLNDWLLSIGCDENLEAWMIDARLPGKRRRPGLRAVGVSPVSLTADERELAEIALDDIGTIERQIPANDYESLRGFMESHWGYPDFHEETQKPAIEAIRTRDTDTLVILPTGTGKSVLFQVPALYRGLMSRRLTIVISPLRALMKDQLGGLQDRGFHQSVDYLSADRPAHELEDVYQGILDHRIVLLYVAPERFRNRRFLDILDRRYQRDSAFEFIVIDETHCVSQWGYEFRPDYFHALETIRTRFRRPNNSEKTPFLLFSATVPGSVRDDLRRLVRGDGGEPYLSFAVIEPDKHGSPIRSHIEIESKSVVGSMAGRDPREWHLVPRLEVIVTQLRKAIEVRNSTGQISGVIVFVSRRIQAEELALQLVEAGLGAVDYFHAGLDRETREHVYSGYKEGRIDVLVATKAFGMGMDIPHIHWAIHLSPPSYLEDYLQEVGRIGRGTEEREKARLDRLTSVLLHSEEDFQANHVGVQRSRVDFPQLKDLWNQIVENAQPQEEGWLALMPDSGFDKQRTSWEIRRAVNRIRNSLFWLERMERVGIIQMVPGLLRVTLNQERLKELAEEGDSDRAIVAGCLVRLASDDNEVAKTSAGEAAEGNAISDEGTREGWIERVISGISNFFGFVLGGKGEGVRPERRTERENIAEPSASVPLREIDVVVGLEQVWRETSLRSSSEVLAELVKLQQLGGLRIARGLSFGQSDLAKKLNAEQVNGLLAEVEKVASNLLRQTGSGRDIELDFETAGLSFQATDIQGKQIEVRYVLERATALVLRLCGIRVREKVVSVDGRAQRVLVATLSAGDTGRASQRCGDLIRLTSQLWAAISSRLAGGESRIDLETLVRITVDVDVQGRFHERALRQSLNLLASLKLAICSEPLVPLSYLLEVRDKGRPLNEGDHQEVLDELRRVNRLAEIRSHAMEVYANLPKAARERFISGYFEARTANDLENYLKEQLREIDDEGGSSFVREKLGQIRADEIGKLFQRYRDPQTPEPNQWKAICHPYDQHLLVNAGPGAGKTSVLIARVAHLIHEQRLRPEQILVLAFNRAVVFEIRAKIRKLFRDLGYGAYVGRLRVYTFHALATRYAGRADKEEDVLAMFADLLDRDVRIAGDASGGIQAIMVDEFQDMNKDIFKIIEVLHRTSGASVMAIGDDDQDILRWNRIGRGEIGERASATWYFQEIESMLSLNSDSKLALKVNFRSGPEIVSRSESLLDKFFGSNAAVARLKHGIRLAPSADNPEAQVDELSGPELWERMLSISKDLLKEVAGTNGTVAFLCRTNDEVAQIYDQMKDTFPGLELQTNNVYPLSRLRHMACWLDLCQKIHDSEDNPLLTDRVRNDLEKVWKGLDIPEVGALSPVSISPWDAWDMIHKERNYPRISSLIDFVKETRTDEFFRMMGRTGNTGSAVVATIHKVKGLEFDAVALFPSQSSFFFRGDPDQQGAASEEARLFYVGMTRAKRHLIFGFGKREQAWWKKSFWKAAATARRIVLEGSPEEVWISWSADSRFGGGQGLQRHIERHVAVGDPVEARERDLWHESTKRKIGVLCKDIRHSGTSKLSVAAVYRYPQSPDDNHFRANPDAFKNLIPEVCERGWSYVVLVSGVVS